MISVSVGAEGVEVRLTGSDRILAWPEPGRISIPHSAIGSATCYSSMREVPGLARINGSIGRALRTIPVLPNHWIFGRRSTSGGRYFFALRHPNKPVLVVETPQWALAGLMVTTPVASALSAALAPPADAAETPARTTPPRRTTRV
jgi:hypothetical protein